jgi:DNA-directed RNA polymerase subunit RPC12/RpoP
MNEENLRYSGPPTVRQSYMTNFLVECPKCGKAAEVTVSDSVFLNNGRLYCSCCSHLEYAKDLVRYNVVVKRNCDNCGQHFERTIPNSKEKVEEVSIPCPHCGITRTFKPRNDEVRLAYRDSGKPSDPIFNLPLWLQQDIRGNLFWAYNRLHLQEMKKYIKSKLRERQTTTHTTMVERLPNFIKDAKNREALLKHIERLEKK